MTEHDPRSDALHVAMEDQWTPPDRPLAILAGFDLSLHLTEQFHGVPTT